MNMPSQLKRPDTRLDTQEKREAVAARIDPPDRGRPSPQEQAGNDELKRRIMQGRAYIHSPAEVDEENRRLQAEIDKL